MFLLASFALEAQTYRLLRNDTLSNRTDDQLAPVPYVHNGDTGIVFMSNEIIPGLQRVKVKRPDGSDGSPMNIHFYDRTEKRGSDNPGEFELGKSFETNGDIGPVTFSGDYTKMCIVQPLLNAAGDADTSGFSGLYFSEWVEGAWSAPEPFPYNSPEINFNTPCYTPDGQILFFAAEGPLDGAVGGMDLYYSMYMNGTWSAPINLGSKINTPEHEIFPFYHQVSRAGNTNLRLYFSSKGHGARSGTFDLFSSTFYEGEWLDPLPVPSLNIGDYDEFGIYWNDNQEGGLFSRRDRRNRFDIWNFQTIASAYEDFGNPGPAKEAHLCYRIYNKNIDTIDTEVFEYEWVITKRESNDSLFLPGHEVKYCFPGPGDYEMIFNITNKLTDTIRYNAANMKLHIPEYEQPIISAPDTLYVGEPRTFSAAASNLPDNWERFVYYWDFGNGEPQLRGESVEMKFREKGEFTVILGAKKELTRSEERMLSNNQLDEKAYKLAVSKKVVVIQK